MLLLYKTKEFLILVLLTSLYKQEIINIIIVPRSLNLINYKPFVLKVKLI